MIATPLREWFSVGSGQRHNFLPLCLLSLALVALARGTTGRAQTVCVILYALPLVNGMLGFCWPLKDLRTGPVWRDQVAAWRADHGHLLAGWPADWTIDLSDRDRPCPTPSTAADPSYDESAWLTRVARANAAAAARPH